MALLHDATSQTLLAALNVRAAKHAHLAHNVANLDTPGFRPTDVDFDTSLAAAVNAGDEAESPMEIIAGAETTPSADGNTVDADRTLAGLASNAVEFTLAAKITTKRMGLLRYVISDGLG